MYALTVFWCKMLYHHHRPRNLTWQGCKGVRQRYGRGGSRRQDSGRSNHKQNPMNLACICRLSVCLSMLPPSPPVGATTWIVLSQRRGQCFQGITRLQRPWWGKSLSDGAGPKPATTLDSLRSESWWGIVILTFSPPPHRCAVNWTSDPPSRRAIEEACTLRHHVERRSSEQRCHRHPHAFAAVSEHPRRGHGRMKLALPP